LDSGDDVQFGGHLCQPGVNFTRFLPTAITCADPKSTKNRVMSSDFFALLGSGFVKAARKMLMKLIPDLERIQQPIKVHSNRDMGENLQSVSWIYITKAR